MIQAAIIEAELKKHGSKIKAKNNEWFFKTGKGQYGYGDKFIGTSMPELRIIAKKYIDTELSEIQNLLNSEFHECRMAGLIILTYQFEKADEQKQKNIYNFYIKNTKRINNWDLVDCSAPRIVGQYLIDKDRKILYKLARSKNLWERRIAVIATATFININDFKDIKALTHILINDDQDLMHKALGWMLREIGKKSINELTNFLESYARYLPRTTLRYAIEKYPEQTRKKYLAIKKDSK